MPALLFESGKGSRAVVESERLRNIKLKYFLKVQFIKIILLFCRSVNSLADQGKQKQMQQELFSVLKSRQK